ncbi:MAG: vitamin K epoxide reductase family protein [Candidatus Saccharibacteria bacterium]
MKNTKNVIKMYAIMTAGSAIGLIASFMQMMDKITLLKDSGAVLTCNINSALSCSTVLNSQQASVLGPPNALISTIMFVFFLAIGLTGLTNSVISKRMRFITQFLALFTLAFGFWFLMQSIFVIQSLCIFCVFNTFGLLLVNATWLKLNYIDIKIGTKFDMTMKKMVVNNYDILIWLIIAVFIIASAIIKFL